MQERCPLSCAWYTLKSRSESRQGCLVKAVQWCTPLLVWQRLVDHKPQDVKLHVREEVPAHWEPGVDVCPVLDEPIRLGPHMRLMRVHHLAAQVGGIRQPVRGQDAHRELHDLAGPLLSVEVEACLVGIPVMQDTSECISKRLHARRRPTMLEAQQAHRPLLMWRRTLCHKASSLADGG